MDRQFDRTREFDHNYWDVSVLFLENGLTFLSFLSLFHTRLLLNSVDPVRIMNRYKSRIHLVNNPQLLIKIIPLKVLRNLHLQRNP